MHYLGVFMDYYGTIIQRERLNRGWSQEGLSKGICSVSYLSKIEKGRTTPSFEITKLLLERLGIQISEQLEIQAKEAIENAYELLFSGCFDELREFNKTVHPYAVPLSLAKGAAAYLQGEDTKYMDVFDRANQAMYEDKKAYYKGATRR